MTEEEFRLQMALLAVDDPLVNIKQVGEMEGTYSAWERNQIALHLHAAYERPRHFLRWSTIQKTMFVGNAPYIENEWKDLMRARALLGEPRMRWSGRKLDCPYFGRPVRSDLDRKTTGDFIRHAHTLNEFEQKSQVPIEQFNTIFEFGGGYGALCYLVHKLGFMGEYMMFDLPEMLLIQEYYLSNTIGGGINVLWDGTIPTKEIDLFVASSSISEVNMELREKIFTTIDARYYYISYLPRHGAWRNDVYFNKLREKTQDEIEWQSWYNPYKTNLNYLYGRKL